MPSISNSESTQLLKTCIDNFFLKKESSHSFFVVSGPKNINKSDIVQELIREHLGQFFYHDFLYIRDLSELICLSTGKVGKKHALKIETPKDKEDHYLQIETAGGVSTTYEDIGAREINHRLQNSPMGKAKIVLIENIERIVPAAANAFLKTLEEPLPNRLIIATVSHQSQLIDTILSRALVIRLQMDAPHEIALFEEQYKDTIEALTQTGHLVQKHEHLKKIAESGTISAFLDNRIAYCVRHHLPSEKRLEIKKMLTGNVNVENLLLYGVM